MDAFTTAARAEAEREYPDDVPNFYDRADNSVNRDVFRQGAVWARDHLAAQEPTDAEVEAAARAIYETYEGLALGRPQHPQWAGEDEDIRNDCRGQARAALAAAKEARR